MKKLYTLLAAATFATSAFAVSPVMKTDFTNGELYLQNNSGRVFGKIDTENLVLSRTTATNVTPLNAPAAGWTALGEGTFRAGLVGELIGLGGEEWNVAIEENTANNEHWYRCIPYASGTPVALKLSTQGEMPDNTYMYVNATDPKKVYVEDFASYGGELLTFGQLVPESQVAIEFVKYVNEQNQTPVTDAEAKEVLERVAKYGTMVDGAITFTAEESFVSLIPAGLVQGVNTPTWGYFNIDGLLGLALPGKALPKEWDNLGVIDFTDGILYPWFGGDPNATTTSSITVKCELQKHVNKAGYYRVRRPWMQEFGQYGATQDLIIDASNPEMVQVPMQSTGLMVQGEGEIGIMGLTQLRVQQGQTFEDIKAGKEASFLGTVKDGKIIIPGTSVLIAFLDQADDQGVPLQQMKPEYGQETIIPLVAAGVEQVVVSDENAPVEYYNLQGVRVANPENGLYIRRQGNKATKVLVK